MNCKPGDIALVVRGPDSGKVVTVLAAFEPGDPIETSIGSGRLLNPHNLPLWHVDRDMTIAFRIVPITAKVCADANLLPLRPPASDESDTQDQDLPAECGA